MARFHRGIPLGLSDELPPPDGMEPSARCRIPGPLGIATDRADDWAGLRSPGVAPEQVAFDSVSFTFSVGADTYRLRPPGAMWDANWYEEIIRPEEARRIIDAVMVQRADDVELVRLLETATFQLAGLHRQGDLVLVRLRPRLRGVAQRIDTPRSTPRPAPTPPPSRSVEEPTIPAEVAAAQADTLKQAAESGVPFCEECARAAARQAAAATA